MLVLASTPVDALFSDIDMPGKMDGLALAQWVRQRRLETRIILTSGGERALGSAKEYASFLAKPYADTDVEHLLRSVLPKVLRRFAPSDTDRAHRLCSFQRSGHRGI
jgi:YesN/AraC family two-component response regulator